MGIMKVAMKRYLKTLSLLAFAAVLSISIVTCAAHCAPTAKTQATHDCCHMPSSTNHASHSDSCNFCSITTASNFDSTALITQPMRMDGSGESSAWDRTFIGTSLLSLNDISPQQPILAQAIYNEGAIAKDYQKLISHLYFELT